MTNDIAAVLREHQRHGAFNCRCGKRIARDGQESYPTLPEHQAAELFAQASPANSIT